jgi:YegS/Rv2252/BmrU family lipid kinase
MSTLVIVNLNAAGGTARKVWQQVEPQMHAHFGAFEVAITASPDEITPLVNGALTRGLTRVVGVGGDGTNHTLINALVGLAERSDAARSVAYGMIPVGTGRDWARAAGIPLNPAQAVAYLAGAHPVLTDVGVVQYTAHDGSTRRRHFLNVASAGLTADVVKRVNAQRTRRPWTFLLASLMAIAAYPVREMRVTLDGQTLHDGRLLLAVAANSTTFGHGMKVAPYASPRDGLLDVLLMLDQGRVAALRALNSVYSGTHLTHSAVRSARGHELRLSADGPLDLELDGEYVRGSDLLYTVRPNLLPLLLR